MKHFRFLLFIVLTISWAILATAFAATYTYKCPKCGLIQQYDRLGSYKCPNDKWILTKQ